MKFAIVDIETTGGSNKSRGITEIGIVVTDGVQESWSDGARSSTPTSRSRRGSTALTGISDDMVEDAPGFHEVAEDVERCSAIVSSWPTTWGLTTRSSVVILKRLAILGNAPNSAPSVSRAKLFLECRGMDWGRFVTPVESPT